MGREKPDPSAKKISVRSSGGPEKPLRRDFPGPRGAADEQRVAIDRSPYAELIAHAKESLDAEVCGVLIGHICEDDEGLFAHVEAIIRGNAASQGATHVTFTQATWDAIHESLERDYPKSRIVGWYHTHPGFGVEFSDMDLFIQRHFFAGRGQIALVTDPLSGAVAIAVNSQSEIKYLSRFWVDAREQIAKTPAPAPSARAASVPGASAVPSDVSLLVKDLEARVAQIVQAYDEQRTYFYRFLYTIGFLVCFALVVAVGSFVYYQYTSRLEPAEVRSYLPIPIKVGDETVMIGVGIVDWKVPPALNALIQKAGAEAAAAEEKEKAKAREGDKTPDGAAPTGSANPASQPAPATAPAPEPAPATKP